jgi:aspartyl/asparaginyl beta-hydroxylase (cupin superfamily)
MNADEILDEVRRGVGSGGLERVEACVAHLAGARPPPPTAPLHEPTRLYFPGLRARPWWGAEELPWVRDIEDGWRDALAELAELDARRAPFFPYEDPYTLELGWRGWDTFTLYRKGKPHRRNAAACPRTVALLGRSPRGLRQGMFTRLQPGARITPHTGGINVVLTCHLGLVIPPGCGLRVGEEARTWEPGRVVVFDDSFVHEAWNDGASTRTVLLWDVWHPDLTDREIAALEVLFPIFDRMLRGALEVAS